MAKKSNQSAKVKSTLQSSSAIPFPPAPFLRRLASWVYDCLTGIAIAMLATVVGFIFTSLLAHFGWVSLAGYQDMGEYLGHGWVFRVYLLLCLTAFYSYFWVRGGQTIGMRAWRLQVLDQQGQMISLTQAVIRFYASLAGLGNLWVLVDRKNKQSLQDHLAKTRTVVLTKAANKEVYRQL